MRKLILTLFFALGYTLYLSAQSYVPITVTGFNHDLIAEGSGTSSSKVTAIMDGSWAVLYAAGFNCGSTGPLGLPANGVINSIGTAGVNYQLQAYSSNNGLYLTSLNQSATLTFQNPGSFAKLSILATSAGTPNSPTSFNAKVNFSDGSNTTYSFTVPDWCVPGSITYTLAIKDIGRVSSSGCTFENNAFTNGVAMYDNIIDLNSTDRAKVINSITITKTVSNDKTGIFGVCGITAAGTPPAVVATAATNIGGTSFTANWNAATSATDYRLDVSISNTFATMVGSYNNLTTGNVTSYSVTGLSPATSYYYRLRGANSNGQGPNSNIIAVTTSSASITFSANLLPFHTWVGTASADQTFTVSGSQLTNDVTVTAPTNWEVSKDGTTYTASVVLPQSGGSLTGQPVTVYVRIAASAPAGYTDGNVALTSSGAPSKDVGVIGIVNSTTIPCDSEISINCPTFTTTKANLFQINGNASNNSTNSSMELTASEYNKAGSAFWKNKLNLKSTYSFSSYFSAKISDHKAGGADGIAYILQNNTSTFLSTGGGIGYDGISPSVVVEFDTYKNAWDPDANHVAIIIDGKSDHSNSPVVATMPFDMKTVGNFHVWVDYNGTVLEVRVSLNDVRPANPVVSKTIDLKAKFGSSPLFIGFSGSTGGSASHHEIYSFLLQNVNSSTGIDPSCTYKDAPSTITVIANPTTIYTYRNSTVDINLKFPDGTNAVNYNVDMASTGLVSLDKTNAKTDANGNIQVIATGVTAGNETVMAIADGGASADADIVVNTLPTALHLTGDSLLPFHTIVGLPSAHQSFEVKGYYLVTDVDVTAPGDYEISLDSTTFSPNLKLSLSGDSLTGQPVKIYVRINATAPMGMTSGDITLTTTNLSSQVVPVIGIVNDTAILCGTDISINCPDFIDTENLFQFNGNAAVDAMAKSLRLTEALNNQAGSAFWKNKLLLDDDYSFSSYFTVKISKNGTPGADGVAFVIQKSTSAALSTGQGIGYDGINPSVAVEFDTYLNGFDPDANHVAIIEDGMSDHSGSPVVTAAPFDMKTAPMFHVWVEYNGVNQTLEVRMSLNDLRPNTALISKVIDVAYKFDESPLFIGFTGSTGGAVSQHEILSFLLDNQYSVTGIDPYCAYLSAPTGLSVSPKPATILLNRSSTVTIHVVNRDGSDAVGKKVKISSGSNLTLDKTNGVTDANGNIVLKATGDMLGTETIKAVETKGANGIAAVLILEKYVENNFITPNGDLKNDTWGLSEYDILSDASVFVYDSYGQLIFSTIGYMTKWDGNYKGKEMKAGEYYYLVKVKDADNSIEKGVILLLR